MENIPLLHRVRNWLGLGAGPDETRTMPELDPFGDHYAESAIDIANRERLADVTAFLTSHDVPVDAETLAFAYEATSGSDPRLQVLVNRRLRDGLPLTREWIEELRGESSADDARTMSELRQRLEKSIADFTKTTHDARSATSDYRSALRSHVDELGEVSKAGAVIIELANVAKAMLERTQDIENQMARSERETRLLQKRLDEARRNAELDHLTGLPNRRAFEALLTNEYTEARRLRDSLCVAFCDIDKFKSINDEHGHDAGDRVLKVVARTLAEISDERCHVARHGGEEFVVLFRGKTLKQSHEALDELREALANRKLVNRANDTPFGQVSFSGGVADVFAYCDPRAALKAADEALYAAKNQGRNRIIMADPALAINRAA